MEPTYGEVELWGVDVLEDPEAARRILGYMPDLAPVPRDLKVWEFLDFHADTHVLGKGAGRRNRLDECLETVGMAHKRKAWCRQLSRGETQRVVLAKTLLHRPRVLILDEPASGLDALSRRELRGVLQTLAREGAAVFVSSHILLELAEMCSSLCVMHHGRLLASGPVEEIRRQLGRSERQLTVDILGRRDEASAWLSQQPGVHDLSALDGRITLGFKGDDTEQAALLAGLIGHGVPVKAFDEKVQSFEDILVDVACSRPREQSRS
jgi:ABC-2 type transport system ATP-binding protein